MNRATISVECAHSAHGEWRRKEFQPDWDLSTIPPDLLRAEYAKSIHADKTPCAGCHNPH